MAPADRPKLDQPREVAIRWDKAESVPVMACNVVLAQHTSQEFVLTFGYASLPVFTTPPTQEELESIQSVQANVVARVGMTPGRVVELIQVLQKNLQTFQEQQVRH